MKERRSDSYARLSVVVAGLSALQPQPPLVGEGPNANWDSVLPVFAAIYVLAGLCWLGFNPDRPIVPEPD